MVTIVPLYPDDFLSSLPAGGGWEGGTGRTEAPGLLSRLGFPPPASPRWGEVPGGNPVAGEAAAHTSFLFPIMASIEAMA